MQAFHLFTADVRGIAGTRCTPTPSRSTHWRSSSRPRSTTMWGRRSKDNRRQNEGFLWADCLIADVDNAAGDVVEPAQIADDLPDVQHYVLYSRHHLLAKGTAPGGAPIPRHFPH